MTKQELIDELNLLAADSRSIDHSMVADHEKADALLCEYIGDPSITKAFESIEKWYA
jgi:hypothetical protein